ncbi:MAG: preprotein translocase subunit SecG [Sphaerochaeta sp.]|jgi:preprotein translocase subunit SecG|nr:preprotein translocase subunit SecG [Sphaerochaeta sp.]MCH3919686.1 preprotein translocase subunit SecG [Sphaerochaeta sp.]MCI2104154.1 preprotein translocase subunit SecG [Sphaerochaeta sp.]
MGVLSVILLVLFIIVCLLLIFIVAIQDEDSQGLGGIFGGASTSAFGSRVGSVVNKFTAILGGVFMVLALVVALLNKTPSQDKLLEQVQTNQVQQTTEWWNQSSDAAAASETAPAAN